MSKKYHEWTEEDMEFVRENAERLTDEQGAAQLSRMRNAVITKGGWKRQRLNLGITKKPGRPARHV